MAPLGVLLALCYPTLVFFGKSHLHPAWLALPLLPLALLRAREQPGRWIFVSAIAALALAAITLRSYLPLKLYPVVVSLGFLTLFAGSILRGPTVVERLARMRHPELPPRAAAYCRRVTVAWSLFFLINGGIALATVLSRSDELWFWYNGVIAYALIGIVFAVEWLCRRRVMRTPDD